LRGGVPFEMAFHGHALAAEEKHALAIILLELDGARFDWHRFDWIKND